MTRPVTRITLACVLILVSAVACGDGIETAELDSEDQAASDLTAEVELEGSAQTLEEAAAEAVEMMREDIEATVPATDTASE